MNRALKGHQKLGRPIESTREALVHHFGRHFQGGFCGAQPRAKDDMSRQLAAPAAKLSALMNKQLTGKSIEQGSGEGKCNRVLKLGLDMHYRQVTDGGDAGRGWSDQGGWQNGPRWV